jgi:hypothetical protein
VLGESPSFPPRPGRDDKTGNLSLGRQARLAAHRKETLMSPRPLAILSCFLSVALAVTLSSRVEAQQGPAPTPPGGTPDGVVTADTPAGKMPTDPKNKSGIVQVGCASCGGGNSLLDGAPGVIGDPGTGNCPTCGCSGGCCYPGRKPCDCDCGDWFGGRFLTALYHATACPDPCYEPRWLPVANAALFVDGVRPVTQLGLRGDFGYNLAFPDRSDYFWAQDKGFKNVDGVMSTGKGPTRPTLIANFGEPKVDYKEGWLHTEGARGAFGLFIDLPYEQVTPQTYPGASGFGDMDIGTKSVLLDSELLMLAFQFKVFIPTGTFSKGLGDGHVSLEPSLLSTLKIGPATYSECQLAYFFPIGGDQSSQGPVFHYGLSLNQILCQCGCEKAITVVGCVELTGYEFTGGAYTDPFTGRLLASRNVGSIVNAGPSVRLDLWNVVDFGIGGQFALTSDHLSESLLRAEFRWRF